MYYNSENYSLTYEKNNHLDEKYIAYITQYILVRPFIWCQLLRKVFLNPLITYKKDTTFIITTYEIKDNIINWLFELLKEMLRKGFVKKIIYKKEFMIIHFYSYLIVKSLSIENYWLILITYYYLKQQKINLKLYLNVDYQSMTQKEEIDLLIIANNEPLIIIDNIAKEKLIMPNINKYLIYLFEKREEEANSDWKKLKFTFNRCDFEKKLALIVN